MVGVEPSTGAIRMDKPLILGHYLMGEFFKMHVDQKSACRLIMTCYNDMFLPADPVLE